ncbi:MAG: DUF4147 domain-containing protein [Chromatiales bacterium]|nr:DUF4147 domain-containing protein [Chromatiales bacterium]
MTQDKFRTDLMQIFNCGIDRVRGRSAVISALKAYPITSSQLHLLAIGKAASDMTLGALTVLGDSVKDGLLITKRGHIAAELKKNNIIELIESDHPLPSDASLHAGQKLLDYLDSRAVAGAHFLFLLSGGASSLVEVLATGMTLVDLKEMTRLLLSKGFDIGQMNALRQAVSCIKGGRLAAKLRGCKTLNLMISDVPRDDPAVIGSGLLSQPSGKLNLDDYPQEIKQCLNNMELVAQPNADAFSCIDTRIVACLDDAKTACVDQAIALGYDAYAVADFIAGDVSEVAERLYQTLSDSTHRLLIWGGEPAMHLPANPGRGGRNQHLALLLAERIAHKEGIYFLIAGTDGSDGPTTDAGALVDANTIARGVSKGFDVKHSLAAADSGHFLSQTKDLISTGPTGTNVMDLMIGLKSS